MKKLHLGCGGNLLDGWENHDSDVDLRKPLPYENNSVDFIFTEHVVEHLFQREAWDYFVECKRILKVGGVVRTTVPSVVKVHRAMSPGYAAFVRERGWDDGSGQSPLKHLVFNHGHQSMWVPDLLVAVLEELGFKAHEAKPYHSLYPELNGIESHCRSVGREINEMESVSVEAVKNG